nr:hypothetical protein RVX_0409 [Nitratidesulfovibrio sp. HK-II]
MNPRAANGLAAAPRRPAAALECLTSAGQLDDCRLYRPANVNVNKQMTIYRILLPPDGGNRRQNMKVHAHANRQIHAPRHARDITTRGRKHSLPAPLQGMHHSASYRRVA